MNKLNILTFPDPRLRKKASPITVFDNTLKKFAEDMLFTMYESKGIGLAATQVDFHQRLIVIDVSDEQNEPYFLVNPSYVVLDETIEHFKEGCLSIPTFFEDIYRPKKIELTYQDLKGKKKVEIFEGIFSVCVQHEIDHLEGKLMVDYLSPLKRDRIRSKLERKKDDKKTN